jgi:DNA-directed RNA polymerase subunit RPC12/RpoP
MREAASFTIIERRMPHYLATRCSQCSKWIPIRECEAEDPTFDPALLMEVVCPHCGNRSKVRSTALEVISESKLKAS